MDDISQSSGLEDLGAQDRSLPDDLRALADDAKALAEAEFAYQKARAAYAGSGAKLLAILGALAAVLFFFTLMALVVGSVIALVPVFGGWGATAVVCGTLLAVIALLIVAILVKVRRMKSVLKDDRKG